MKHIHLILLIVLTVGGLNAVWEKTNGPTGGYVNAITEQAGILYVATGGNLGENGDVYMSEDNGESWRLCSQSFNLNYGVKALASNHDYIFAGTTGYGLYRSSDPESGWDNINDIGGLPQISVSSIYADNDILVLGMNFDGVFLSSDNGDSWQDITYNLNSSRPAVKNITLLDEHIYIASSSGVYRLEDDNWNLLESIPEISPYSVDTDGAFLYIAGLNDSYRYDPQSGEVMLLSISHNKWFFAEDGNLFAADNQTLYRSADSGVSWDSFEIQGTHETVVATAFHASDDLWLVANGIFTLYKSTDEGASWSESSHGVTNITVNDLALHQDKMYAVTEFADFGRIFSTDNQGEEWIFYDDGADFIGYSSVFSGGDYMLAGSFGAGMYRSEDGVAWQQLSFDAFPNSYPTDIIEHDGAVYTGMLGFHIDVYRSEDEGQTFEALEVPGEGDIKALLSYGSMLLYGRTDNVYFSIDDGQNWMVLGNGFGSLPFVNQIIEHREKVFIVAGRTLFYLNDSNDWTQISTPNDFHVNAIASTDEGLLVGGYVDGVWLYDDNGDFTPMNEGLPVGDNGIYPKIMAFGSDEDYYYMSIEMFGVYRTPIDLVSVDDNEGVATVNTMLVYPNPVGPSMQGVNLSFSLRVDQAASSDVEVAVYNIRGQRVKTLHRGRMDEGPHLLTWDGRNEHQQRVSSGVYLLRLNAGSHSQTSKVMILK